MARRNNLNAVLFFILAFVCLATGLMFALKLSAAESCAHENVTYYARVEATCTSDGNVEYWHCEECGKNFADEDLSEELTDVVLPAGHSFGEDGVCTVCGYSEDGSGLNAFPSVEGFYTYNGMTVSDCVVYYLTEDDGCYYIADDGTVVYVYTAADIAAGLSPISIVAGSNGCGENSYAYGVFTSDDGELIILNNVKTPHSYGTDGICTVCGAVQG